MRRHVPLQMLLAIAFTVGACSGGDGKHFTSPVQPSTPSPPSMPQGVREITIGESVTGNILGAWPPCTTNSQGSPVPCRYYAFTPTSSGRLTVTLTYDAIATDTILLLRLEDTNFEPVARPWSPIVGKMDVVAGRRYALEVGLDGTGEEQPYVPYTLTTVLE
jgi:hypothetical protein